MFFVIGLSVFGLLSNRYRALRAGNPQYDGLPAYRIFHSAFD